MSFDYDITADPSKAVAAANQVDAANIKVEQQAAKTGKALSDAYGTPAVRDSAGRFIASGVAAQQAADKAAGLSEQWKLEEQMLSKILAPMKEYESGLKALDGLLDRNAITTKEYADQVTNLNRKLGEKPSPAAGGIAAPRGGGGGEEAGVQIEGSLSGAFAGQLGEAGTALQGLASKGAIEAAALAGITVEAIHLGDEYVELSNKALKLADSTHSVDDVLDSQLQLSKEVHGSLEQTIELSTVVKERTEDMALSTKEQTDFTKELAQATTLSGKSIGEASGLINRFAFALESGIPAGRQIKQIMIEFPPIAEAMKEHFHATSAELIAMGNKGQISLESLRQSLNEVSGDLDKKMGDRVETLGAQWGHFKDELVLTAGKLIEHSGILKLISGAMKVLGDVMGFIVGTLTMVHDALGNTGLAFVALGAAVYVGLGPLGAVIGVFEGIKSATGALVDALMSDVEARTKLNAAEAEALEKYNKEMEAVINQLDAIQRDIDAHNELFEAITQVSKAMAEGEDIYGKSNTKMAEQIEKAHALAAAVEQVKSKLDLIKDPSKKMVLLNSGDVKIIRDYQDAQQAVLDQSSRYGEQLEKIHKGEVERQRGVADLNEMLQQGIITQTEYNKAIQAYVDHATKAHKAALLFGSAIERKKIDQSGGDYGDYLNVQVDEAPEVPKEDKNATKALELYKAALEEVKGPIQKYRDELDQLDTLTQLGDLNTQAYATTVGALRRKYDDIRSPAQSYAEDVHLAHDKLESNIYTLDEYNRKLDQLHDKYDTFKTPAEDFRSQFDKIVQAQKDGIASTEGLQLALDKLYQQFDHGTLQGFQNGWDEIKKQTEDTATTVSTSMKSAFDQVNSNIVDMVTKGKADWSKLGDQIEQDAAKLALQTVEKSVVSAVSTQATDTVGAAMTGETTGASAAATMLAAAPEIGAAIGAAYAATAQAAAVASGAESGATSAAASGIAEAAFATGGQYIVGGPSGTDQSLQAFWATRGERVTVETQDQQYRSDSNGGRTQAMSPPATNVVVQNRVSDQELLSAIPTRVGDRTLYNSLRRLPGQARQPKRR